MVGHWDPRGQANDHYRPVIAASLALDYRIWGTDTRGYHLTSLIIAAVSALVVFRLLRRLEISSSGALAGSLAWCAHPIAAASTCWANQRTDSIMVIFYLACLAFVLSTRFGRRQIAAVLACGALALGSKETAVTLSAVAIGAIWWFQPSGRSRRYATAAALMAMTVVYVAWWFHLFPSKAAGGARMASELSLLADPSMHPIASLYPAVFLPWTYQSFMEGMQNGFSLWYLAAGWLVWPMAYGVLLGVGADPRARRNATAAGVWPMLTVAPLLALTGGVDTFRLGLLMSFGFALLWAVLTNVVEHGHRSLAIAAVLLLIPWLGPRTIESCEAWAPGGFMHTLGTRWKMESVWLNEIDPGMKEVFLEQVQDQQHAHDWIRATD